MTTLWWHLAIQGTCCIPWQQRHPLPIVSEPRWLLAVPVTWLLGNGIIYEGRSFHESFLCRLTVAVSKKIVDFFLCYLYRTHTKNTQTNVAPFVSRIFLKRTFPKFQGRKEKKHTHTAKNSESLGVKVMDMRFLPRNSVSSSSWAETGKLWIDAEWACLLAFWWGKKQCWMRLNLVISECIQALLNDNW